ncbi:hypothetical protein CC80DRAFT_539331 [Byssothecium circinans]|uniref:TNFR-Cys domain-containing protein n=1 Tax=Byssothecium circinans TaxID=147558 RepID=A0A6A5TED9_9PLEO|nr:hypothetical protein CC80DRAFT_539331 [Byssothecium circinans]
MYPFLVFFAPLPIAAILDGRQYYGCTEDDCLRAVNGTTRGPDQPVMALNDCRDYMTTTLIVDPIYTTTTLTTSSGLTILPSCGTISTSTGYLTARETPAAKLHKNSVLEGHQEFAHSVSSTAGPIPSYATSACTLSHFSSACSCIGITAGLVTSSGITVTQTLTTMVITTSIGSCPIPAPTIGTTSDPGTSTTYTITMSHSSTTSTTTVVIPDPTRRGTATGTGTGTSSSSKGTSIPGTPSRPQPTSTPPYGNDTTSYITSIKPTCPSDHPTNTTLPPTTLPPSNTTLPPIPIPPSNTTLPPTTLPPSNTTLPPTPTPPSNTTLPPTTLPPSNTTLPPVPTPPSNTTLPPTSIPPSNTTLPPIIPPPSNTTFPPMPIPPSNTTLPPTTLPPTNTTSPPTSTPTNPCGGRGVKLCSGICTDTKTDVEHCGSCDNVCKPGHYCTNGVCTRPACDSDCEFARLCGLSNANVTCACGLDSSNAQVCYNRSFDCNAASPGQCDSTAECDVGTICVPDACCGSRGGRCVSTEGCGVQGEHMELGERVRFGKMGKRSIRLHL